MNGLSPRKAARLAAERVRWHFGVNDPDIHSWVAVGGYALGAALAFRAAGIAARSGEKFEHRFWQVVCAILLTLGINKQLDLHVLLIDLGRNLALDNGLFAERRQIQRLFILAVAAAAGVVLVAAAVLTRRRQPAVRWALAGIVITCAYGFLRAASFSHVDRLLQAVAPGLETPWPLEIAGIAITIVAASRYRPGDRGPDRRG